MKKSVMSEYIKGLKNLLLFSVFWGVDKYQS